jgi:hypothetical protein
MNIDIEKVGELVAQQVSNEVFNAYHDGWSKRIIDRVNDRIDALINATATETINAKVAKITEDAFFAPYRPVNVFGQPVAETTTIAASLEKATRDYWLQKVDKNGNPKESPSYGEKMVSRADWFIAKVMSQTIEETIDKDLIVTIAANVKDTVRAELRGKVDTILGQLFHVQSADDQAEKRKV